MDTATTNILSTLSSASHSFLQPPPELHLNALSAVKDILDPLAEDIANAQKLRRDENRKKRKRGDSQKEDAILQLRQVYTKGLVAKQVWEQARRILDAACSEVQRDIDATNKKHLDNAATHDEEEQPDYVDDADLLEDEDLEEEDDMDDDMSNIQDESDGISDEDAEMEDLEDIEDIEDIEHDDSDIQSDSNAESEEPVQQTYVQDPNKLNDGFFSIDDFNRQTQFLEQQDARGEDDDPSDEDDIDWAVDPLTMQYHYPKEHQDQDQDKDQPASDDDDDDDEEGPTFGDADLDASDSDQDSQEDGLAHGVPAVENTNDVRYADFFAPPPKKPSKTKRMRALPKTQPSAKPTTSAPQTNKDLENDLQRAISDVRRDLLESEEELSDDEDATNSDSDGSLKKSSKNLSTHEKQRAKIAAEIRRLEAASIAKRDWTLSGEARGADRPINSLLEEDLEFERVGKPVPVITAEVTEEIEALIKRRILAREFDEVIRRRPDDLGTDSNATRRGRIELDDTKPSTGLGEVYEQQHLAATDPNYTSTLSAAAQKQHAEISRLWKEVSSQLDLLSNLHFKPKRTEAEIKTVEDKPTISMEDARPVGLADNGNVGMLAPQEVYRPGEDKRPKSKSKNDGEADDFVELEGDENIIIRSSGLSTSRDEMTREEKLRRRRRDKERIKTANQNQGISSKSNLNSNSNSNANSKSKTKSGDRNDIITQLAKGNVKIIGKGGELQNIDGKGKKKMKKSDVAIGADGGGGAAVGGGNLKL
ncbi:hypothetical protein PV10_08401 [Exophiala mesophila]|uniref:U3 small nucleolar ribonucleoprotein protein MPP10 n=1 Tax=Exophiala mesophila TaxID=212818 RepID=A0A0D1XKM3_EXOME|nr:uncharacterized protein PV10_08401 [Exophiala mesophila]KIV88751.1 hypothetical protein PV10_08401 [Exophiala mesophila]